MKFPLFSFAAAALCLLAFNAGATNVDTGRARLDGSVGRTMTHSVFGADVSRSVTEPRDPYTEGA